MRTDEELRLGDMFWDCLHAYWRFRQAMEGSGVGAINPAALSSEGGHGLRKDVRDYVADFQRCAKVLNGINRRFFESYFLQSRSKADLRRLEKRVRYELNISKKEFPQREVKVEQAVGAILEERELWPARKYFVSETRAATRTP